MIFFTILGLIYGVAQVLVPCLPPVPLSSEVLSTDKYLGKWYYVGVASWDDEDIESYKPVDNSVVELKKGENTLIMSGALKQEGQCINRTWTYNIDPDFDPIMSEGEEHFGAFLDGTWIKCPSCLIIVKIHPDKSFLRIMLFARSEKTSADVIKEFKSKMECFHVINRFIISPRAQEFCKLEGTA